MTQVAAYNCRVYATGTAVAMTGEACSGSGGSYQITNTAKRAIDPATAVVVYDNGVAQAADTYSLNFQFGKIKKASGSFTGPVTIDGAYLPLLELDATRDFSFDITREQKDVTVFSANDYTRTLPTLHDASGKFTIYASPDVDYDTGGGTLKLYDVLAAGTLKLIEITGLGNSQTFRAFCRLSDISVDAKVDDILKVSASWQSIYAGKDSSFGFSTDPTVWT